VFGALAAETMVAETAKIKSVASQTASTIAAVSEVKSATPEAATERWIAELRELMWRYAGLLRDEAGLNEAKRRLDALAATMPRGVFRRAIEARNLHVVAALVVTSALGREESRGAHYRNDFPLRSAAAKHSVMQRGRLEFVDRPQGTAVVGDEG